MPEQARFYDRHILPYVNKDERIVVIISDGLRYESAVELTEILNREQKGESDLTAMLGVLPSYTDLGMAAWLPHMALTYAENGTFFADGISTKGTDNRSKVLAAVKAGSIAMTYENVMRMNKQQMQEAFGGKKLIYIYHNAIDGGGDKAATEFALHLWMKKASASQMRISLLPTVKAQTWRSVYSGKNSH